MAVGAEGRGLPFEEKIGVLLAGGLWAACLGGAAAALSTALAPHKQAGSAGEAVPRHRSLGWVGTGLMLIGLVAAPVFSWWYFDAYLCGIILVVLYAAPPLRFARWP